jgi:hypothetical protein
LPIVRIAADAIVGQYGAVEIRPFEAAHATAAAELVRPLQPAIVLTPASLVHRERTEPERARRRSWLAFEDADLVGFATSAVKWTSPASLAGCGSAFGRTDEGAASVRLSMRRRKHTCAPWECSV